MNSNLHDNFLRWYRGELPAPEDQELFSQLNLLTAEELELLLFSAYEGLPTEAYFSVAAKQKLADNIIGKQRPAVLLSFRKMAAVAAVLLLMATGLFIFIQPPKKTATPVAQQPVVNDVSAPDNTRAVITLANGNSLYLDSAGNGTLLNQQGVALVKNGEGDIEYISGENTQGKASFNTLFNPRGSKVVNLKLADGTKVWLNAESSLKYPVAFTGNERKVEISGEAYFEVAHDANKPFYVSKGDIQVKVLGTHFNVNAYNDENYSKVTLLEGSVKTSMVNGQSSVLKPGQQATIQDSRMMVRDKVDVDEVMAWKNGLFLLDNTDLPSLMRQVSRWYDVDIQYKGSIPQRRFEGGVSKALPLSGLQELLAANGIRTALEGKVLIVQP